MRSPRSGWECAMRWPDSLRHAARNLRRNPRLSLPVLATFGLAIGASGAVYGLMRKEPQIELREGS